MISRRQFLIGSAGMGLLSAAVGARHLKSYPTESLTLRTLSDREAHIYRCLGEWLIPPSEALPGHGGDDISIQNIDNLIAEVPDATRQLLLALPLAFEHGPMLLDWAGAPMTSLSSDGRNRYLGTWVDATNTAQCQLFAALKTLYGFAYYERVDVLLALGIPGACANLLKE